MSTRHPVRVEDRLRFDSIIDARSPAEYALDHIPGAINCPVLDDEERAIVGTLYKQVSAFEARRVGGAMVAANLARHLRTAFADRPERWRPLVYCWRGGMRSGAMVNWMRLVGWDAQQLAGGYKSWRRHVIARLDAHAPQLQLRVLCGATGSAKTRVLQALAAQGQQVLDLEGCARHRGSVLGAWPGVAQPSQTGFETQIVDALDRLDAHRPIYIEAESARIGRLNVPQPLVQRLRASPCIEIHASAGTRLAYLLRDYANLADDPAHLAQQLGTLKELHGRQVIAQWQAWAQARDLAPLFAQLMALHYDPLYERSQSRNLYRWAQRQSVLAPDLSDAAIAALARAIAALPDPVPGPADGPPSP